MISAPNFINKRLHLTVNLVNIRFNSFSEAAAKPKKKYSHTVRLPKTKFRLWLNVRDRIKADENIISRCGFEELYSWQRNNKIGTEFVLHDGPPYANGLPHMGHAINKILKDIVTRNKLLKGHKVQYIPGWDCHGLPIELKALAGLDVTRLSPVQIRKRARKFAQMAIQDQKNVFKSWGVMANWSGDCYYTFDKSYIKNQMKQFLTLYEKGLIYRALKPVYWSPSSRTALAEAELVYRDHRTETVTVRWAVNGLPDRFASLASRELYLLTWTTTPWSLAGNQAVAVHPDLSYSIVSWDPEPSAPLYIIASELLETWQDKLNKQFCVIASLPGSELVGWRYEGPGRKEMPVVGGSHVTAVAGTGLVHIAPAHGHEDFLLGKQHNLDVVCVVDESGRLVGPLEGKKLEEHEAVFSHLGPAVLHSEQLTHSYPYDWRTDQPVVIRASQQWFFDTDAIKQTALEMLENVEIVPGGDLSARLESRPYWCISRQRVWGVPVPSLYLNDSPIINRELVEHYCQLVDSKGTDFWWTESNDTLLPKDIAAKLGIKSEDIEVGTDILDIWFDSGLSWSSVLEGKVADLYLEGVDQFTGWFQSSLLTSTALQHKAPYKKIFVHGFAVDDKGRKMSKSVGNVVNPIDITMGLRSEELTCGVDLLRWWVGAHGHHANVPVSDTTLADCSDAIYKLRNISRFILGNLSDYQPCPEPPKLFVVDQFILHSLADLQHQLNDFYEGFQFNKVCGAIIYFVVNQLSGFYCHLIKDRLYCESEDSMSRQSAQFTLDQLLEGLLIAIGPILPLLTEEIYSHHPLNTDKKHFFFKEHEMFNTNLLGSKYKINPVIEQALAVKAMMIKSAPVNLNSWKLCCSITANPSVYSVLRVLQKSEHSTDSELAEILQVSSVTLRKDENLDSFLIDVKPTTSHHCDRCRKFTAEEDGKLCKRCFLVVSSLNV